MCLRFLRGVIIALRTRTHLLDLECPEHYQTH